MTSTLSLSHDPIRHAACRELEIVGKALGRHVCHDERSREFVADQSRGVQSVHHPSVGLPLDQRDHKCSTAHSLCAALNTGPNFGGREIYSEAEAIHVYEVAKTLEGEAAPEVGSSALMACKAAQRLGMIHGYQHAFGLDEALRALVLRPVMSGFHWYTSFDSPNEKTGVIEIKDGATVRGGHELLAFAIDAKNELVWCWNSWGRSYGHGGKVALSFGTWERLLHEDGDVTIPIAHLSPR